MNLAQGAPSAPQAAAPAAPGGGGSSQQDYSAEWASYYRSIGKNDEADAIEKQIANRVRRLEYFVLVFEFAYLFYFFILACTRCNTDIRRLRRTEHGSISTTVPTTTISRTRLSRTTVSTIRSLSWTTTTNTTKRQEMVSQLMISNNI